MRWVCVAVGAALSLTAFGVTSTGAATSTAPKPVVTATPRTALVDLQQITVTGSGFSPNTQIGTAECGPGATVEANCDLGTVVYVQTDSHGKFALSRYVRRLISVNRKTIDCGAAKGCIVGAATVSNLTQASGRTIFFNPKIPAKVATVTVAPGTQLADHQLVAVSGKGFAPSTGAYISQCVTHPPTANGQICDYSTQRSVTVASNGTFTAPNFVLERRQVVFTKNKQSLFDCASKPGACEVQVSASGIGPSTPATTPLTFGVLIKPAVAAVQVAPALPLQDLQAITLTGTGFTPGFGVTVEQCALGTTTTPNCDYSNVRTVTANFHGGFTLSYTVRRDITSATPTGTAIVDCATDAGTCELAVQGTPSQPTTTATLTFDPNIPAVTPSIAASPNTGLSDNQLIAVSLGGFTPNQPVQIIECSAEAISEAANLSYCDYNTSQTVTPNASSTSQSSFVARAVLGGPSGLVDCTAQPGACVLVATENGGYYGGGIAVSGALSANIAFTNLSFSTS